METSKPSFALARATELDLDEIVQLIYDCFDEDIRMIFMGCASPADLPKPRAKFAQAMKENPYDVWLKVTDLATGKIIATANWRLYVNGRAGKLDKTDEPCEWLEGDWLDKSQRIPGMLQTLRNESMPGPFVYLHICCTDAKYRRRGAGGMMLRWGCDVADQLFLPAWIEASPDGNLLYKAFGFYDFVEVPGDMGIAMKRDPRSAPELGGKAAPDT